MRFTALLMVIVFGLPVLAQFPVQTHVKPQTLYVTVRDKQGNLIVDLKSGDFSIAEDGRPQEITAFIHDATYPATIGLIVETSVSSKKSLAEVQKASNIFIDEILLHPNDKMFVVHFDTHIELLQEATSAEAKLHAAIAELATSQQQRNGQNIHEFGDAEWEQPNVLFNDAIFLTTNEIAKPLPGRKVMVLISDGVDRSSQESLADVMESAQRANLVIDTIYVKPDEELAENKPSQQGGPERKGFDLRDGVSLPHSVEMPGDIDVGVGGGSGARGVGNGSASSAGTGAGNGMDGTGVGNSGMDNGGADKRGGGGRGVQPLAKPSNGKGEKVLERIARETGGSAYVVDEKTSLDTIFKTIDAELADQYVLTYTPDQGGSSMDYRKIAVSVKRAEAKAQAREGYYLAAR